MVWTLSTTGSGSLNVRFRFAKICELDLNSGSRFGEIHPQTRPNQTAASLLAPSNYPNLKMTSFLQIASQVEAAVAAYTSVCNFADKHMWKENFKMELVSTNKCLFTWQLITLHLR